MKAATGELNLTVITLIAISAILAFFWWMWDNVIKGSINENWNKVNDARDNKDNEAITVPEYIVVDDYIIDFSK